MQLGVSCESVSILCFISLRTSQKGSLSFSASTHRSCHDCKLLFKFWFTMIVYTAILKRKSAPGQLLLAAVMQGYCPLGQLHESMGEESEEHYSKKKLP